MAFSLPPFFVSQMNEVGRLLDKAAAMQAGEECERILRRALETAATMLDSLDFERLSESIHDIIAKADQDSPGWREQFWEDLNAFEGFLYRTEESALVEMGIDVEVSHKICRLLYEIRSEINGREREKIEAGDIAVAVKSMKRRMQTHREKGTGRMMDVIDSVLVGVVAINESSDLSLRRHPPSQGAVDFFLE